MDFPDADDVAQELAALNPNAQQQMQGQMQQMVQQVQQQAGVKPCSFSNRSSSFRWRSRTKPTRGN
jgi:hypothetical protein